MTPLPLEYKAIAQQWLLCWVGTEGFDLHKAKAIVFARIQEVVG